jgi:hypothetical protein
MEHFKSLSYDGFGINGRDEFRSRIATFASSLSEEQRREFGPLFAAAPEMRQALAHSSNLLDWVMRTWASLEGADARDIRARVLANNELLTNIKEARI